jgi:hypothetical protein
LNQLKVTSCALLVSSTLCVNTGSAAASKPRYAFTVSATGPPALPSKARNDSSAPNRSKLTVSRRTDPNPSASGT